MPHHPPPLSSFPNPADNLPEAGGRRAERAARPATHRVALAFTALSGLLLTLGTGGCVRYQPKPINPSATAQDWTSRTLADAGLHAFVAKALPASPALWPLPQWDLNHLTLAAIYEQPDLAVARAQWSVSRAARLTAAQRPNPTVSPSLGYDSTKPPPWIPDISFDIPIETAGKRGDRMRQARADAEAARWDWIGQIWKVRTDVRTAFVNLHDARARAALLSRLVSAQTQLVHLLEGQLAAGEVSRADVTPARIALDRDTLALQQARQHETETLGTLADAIGLPVDALRHVDLSFVGIDRLPPPPAENDIRRTVALNRADVRSALATYASSQAALQLEIANQYPDIHLGPGYQLDQTDNKWTLGVSFPIPLMNRNQGPIAEARARRRLAAARFVAIQARAINEASLALAGYRDSVAQVRTSAGLMHELAVQLASARQRARAGDVDPLTVASAEIEYDNAASAHLDALLGAEQALGRLETATESPLILPARVLGQAETSTHPIAPFSHEP